MSDQTDATLEREIEDLRTVVEACHTGDDVENLLASRIQQYVRDKRFDLFGELTEMALGVALTDVMEKIGELIRYYLTRRDIPQEGELPALSATLMALPVRIRPALLASLTTPVPRLETALGFGGAAAIVSQLPLHARRTGDAFYVATPRLYTTEQLSNLTFDEVDEIVSSMEEAFFERRQELAQHNSEQFGLTAKTMDNSAEEEGDTEAASNEEVVTTVEALPGTAFLLYLQIIDPKLDPLSTDGLSDEERYEFSVAMDLWFKSSTDVLSAAFNRELRIELDELPSPFFAAIDGKDVFEWFVRLREGLTALIALNKVAVEDLEVKLEIFTEEGTQTWMDSTVRDARLWLIQRSSGRLIGTLSVPMPDLEAKTPQELEEGVGAVLESLGITAFDANLAP